MISLRKYLFNSHIIIIIICIIASTFTFGQSQKKTDKRKPQTKESAPKVAANYGKYNFSLKTLDGKAIKLSDYAGKVVLVNIWAPWCQPCKMETPGFVKLYEQYHKKGFEIVGVAVQTNESEIRKFIYDYKIRWAVGIKDDITKQYGAFGIPNSYLFRPNGSLVKEFIGYTDEKALKPLIEETLKIISGKK
ncbi:MAG: TlpA disulfide reductase family protein [Bacteroidota bacterium]|nr:TlpA disulfide reductase family protein [Bacteroidota bacterium]